MGRNPSHSEKATLENSKPGRVETSGAAQKRTRSKRMRPDPAQRKKKKKKRKDTHANKDDVCLSVFLSGQAEERELCERDKIAKRTFHAPRRRDATRWNWDRPVPGDQQRCLKPPVRWAKTPGCGAASGLAILHDHHGPWTQRGDSIRAFPWRSFCMVLCRFRRHTWSCPSGSAHRHHRPGGLSIARPTPLLRVAERGCCVWCVGWGTAKMVKKLMLTMLAMMKQNLTFLLCGLSVVRSKSEKAGAGKNKSPEVRREPQETESEQWTGL